MEDRISGLPDEILHCILLRLRSTRAAARTSLLSRRWRRIWTDLPEIFFDAAQAKAATIVDAVDGALAACVAPLVDRLDVSISRTGIRVRACQVEPWLRFASTRRVKTLHIDVPSQKRWRLLTPKSEREEEELDLPVWDAATSVTLKLDYGWRLRLPSVGLFADLINLEINNAIIESSELGTLVSSRCPRLRNLSLCIKLVALSTIYMRSDTLHSLFFRIQCAQRLELHAPKLEEISVDEARIDLHISAPELAKVTWNGNLSYHPYHHQLTNAARHLKLLESDSDGVAASLLQRFDEVDKLILNLDGFSKGTELYASFVNENIKLPKCETLHVSLGDDHNFASRMLYLLRTCDGIRKLSLSFYHSANTALKRDNSCPLSCNCRLPSMTDGIILSSLEEVEIRCFRSSHGELQFLEMLSRCTTEIIEKLVIYTGLLEQGTSLTKEICKNIRNMFNPNLNVVFIPGADPTLRQHGLLPESGSSSAL